MSHPSYLKVKIADDLTIVSPKKALEIAKEHQPFVCQHIKHLYDYLTNFDFGEDHPYPEIPNLYFAVLQKDKDYYIVYMFYHWRDDNHRHDTESLLFLPTKNICVAVNHFSFKCQNLGDWQQVIPAWHPRICIEMGSHAIFWTNEGLHFGANDRFPGREQNHIYNNFYYVNMLSPKFQANWEYIREMIAPSALMPDQFVDTDLENRLKKLPFKYRGHRVRSCRGDFLCNPPRLIEALK